MEYSSVSLGDKIELTKKIELVNAETYYSMIFDIIDDSHMLIQAPIDGGKIIPLEMETVYYICIYTKRGLFRCEAQVTKRIKDKELHYLELTIMTPLKKYQRRQYYRMNCIFNFRYKDGGEDEWEKGTVLDISGGGIRFLTSKKLESEQIVQCVLNLLINEIAYDIEVEGSVLQSKATDNDHLHFHTRIMFLDLSVDDTEKIIKFIFEEERRRRKKEKGL